MLLFLIMVFILGNLIGGGASVTVSTTFLTAPIGVNGSLTSLWIAYPNGSQYTNLTVLDFEHGLAVAEKDYQYLSSLASSGTLAVISSGAHDSTLAETTKELAVSMQSAWAWVKLQSQSNASFPLFGRLSGLVVAGGHSMGGGATFISVAASHPGTFFATLTFAPCGYASEVYPFLPNVTVPSMVLAASRDCLCHDRPIHEYDALKSGNKWLVDITDGSHCNFCAFTIERDRIACEAAEGVQCPLTKHIKGEAQREIALMVSSLWLSYLANGQQNPQPLTDTLNSLQKQGKLTWKKSTPTLF